MTLLPKETSMYSPSLLMLLSNPSSLSALFGHISELPTHMVYLFFFVMLFRSWPRYNSSMHHMTGRADHPVVVGYICSPGPKHMQPEAGGILKLYVPQV